MIRGRREIVNIETTRNRRANKDAYESKSSPSFREKLAEREESIRLGKGMFRLYFMDKLSFRTIRILLEYPTRMPAQDFDSVIHLASVSLATSHVPPGKANPAVR
jgi:hypothetical protein